MIKIKAVDIRKVVFNILLAIPFSLLFIYSPLSQSVLEENPDVANYLIRINNILHNSDTILDDMDLLQYLSNEPVWGYILTLIGDYFYNPLEGLQLISFFSIFIFSFFLFERVNLLLAAVFLFNPMIVDLINAQIRSAFAMALLLVALMIKNRLLSIVILIVTSMIHSVTYIIFMVYIIANFIDSYKNRFTHKQLGMIALFVGVILSVILGAGKDNILSSVGDRRVNENVGTGSSIAYLTYWILLSLVMPFIPKNNKLSKESWTEYYAIIMLMLPFLMAIFGTNGTRFIPLSFPFFLYAISTYVVRKKIWLIGSLFFYQIIQYLYWYHII
jgi:hypothetical protein